MTDPREQRERKVSDLTTFILLTWLWAHSGLSWWIYSTVLLVATIFNLVMRCGE